MIEEWEIVSVGRKLLKAKRKGWLDYSAIAFEKRELGYGDKFVEKTNLCINFVLFASLKELEEEIERKDLLDSISEYFRGYGAKNISLDSLRKIAELIK